LSHEKAIKKQKETHFVTITPRSRVKIKGQLLYFAINPERLD